jgi:hypothetical protein
MKNATHQRRTICPADVQADTAIIIKLPDAVRRRWLQAAQGEKIDLTGRNSIFPVAVQAFLGHIAKIFGQTGQTTGQGEKHAS